MSAMLLTEHHLEFLSLKGGCTGSSESTHAKMPHCWKSHVAAPLYCSRRWRKIVRGLAAVSVMMLIGFLVLDTDRRTNVEKTFHDSLPLFQQRFNTSHDNENTNHDTENTSHDNEYTNHGNENTNHDNENTNHDNENSGHDKENYKEFWDEVREQVHGDFLYPKSFDTDRVKTALREAKVIYADMFNVSSSVKFKLFLEGNQSVVFKPRNM